jgi:hypothetical protein
VVNQGGQISNPRTGQLMTLISADPAQLRLDTLSLTEPDESVAVR